MIIVSLLSVLPNAAIILFLKMTIVIPWGGSLTQETGGEPNTKDLTSGTKSGEAITPSAHGSFDGGGGA